MSFATMPLADKKAMNEADELLSTACQQITTTVIGHVAGVVGGQAVLEFDVGDRRERRIARSMVVIGMGDIGREVVLTFLNGDIDQPLIMGMIQPLEVDTPTVSVKADGDRLVLTATKEIVLECGEARITLTRAGKVLIHGAYLLSRSSGVNRIKGGSVQIN